MDVGSLIYVSQLELENIESIIDPDRKRCLCDEFNSIVVAIPSCRLPGGIEFSSSKGPKTSFDVCGGNSKAGGSRRIQVKAWSRFNRAEVLRNGAVIVLCSYNVRYNDFAKCNEIWLSNSASSMHILWDGEKMAPHLSLMKLDDPSVAALATAVDKCRKWWQSSKYYKPPCGSGGSGVGGETHFGSSQHFLMEHRNRIYLDILANQMKPRVDMQWDQLLGILKDPEQIAHLCGRRFRLVDVALATAFPREATPIDMVYLPVLVVGQSQMAEMNASTNGADVLHGEYAYGASNSPAPLVCYKECYFEAIQYQQSIQPANVAAETTDTIGGHFKEKEQSVPLLINSETMQYIFAGLSAEWIFMAMYHQKRFSATTATIPALDAKYASIAKWSSDLITALNATCDSCERVTLIIRVQSGRDENGLPVVTPHPPFVMESIETPFTIIY